MDFTTQQPADAYAALRQTHLHAAALESRRRSRVLWALAGTMLLLLMLSFGPVRDALAVPGAGFAYGVVALLLALFIFLVTRYLKAQFAIDNRERLLTMYDTALRRVDGTETQSGQTGPPVPAGHLYARDLDLLGPDSLFGLLDTARTTVGEQGLAHYLLHLVPQPESSARQQAVKELMPQHNLREQLTLLGATNLHRISASLVEDWLAAPAPAIPTYLRPALVVTAALATALVVHPGWFGLHPWSAVLPYLSLVLALQGLLCYRVRAEAGPLLTTSMRLQGSMRLFAEGLALLDSLTFTCPKLRELQAAAREPAGAVAELKRLQSMMSVAEQRGQPYFLPLSLLTAAGTQTAISLARWKSAHVPAMRRWLAAWGEFEALNALATFAFEHPDYCWPELLPADAPPRFEARTLRHPLLKAAVANDVSLDSDSRFYLISGSNMSGKSTLLRAVGVNAVLAYAGAPVAAERLAVTPLTLGASLALTDSLAEGKSRFLAEVERLSGIVAASKAAPVLFLVDEIFSGTNSSDRRTAAGAVLRALLQHGALGALSTHDLALTDLATEANAGVNLHMASPDADDPLAFDYQLKPGANKSSNALAVVRMMGLEV